MKVKIKKSIIKQAINGLMQSLKDVKPQLNQEQRANINYQVQQIQIQLGRIQKGLNTSDQIRYHLEKMDQVFRVAQDRREDQYLKRDDQQLDQEEQFDWENNI